MIKILNGDSKKLIKTLENQSIDCVVTSPPYYRLRDYGHKEQLGMESSPENFIKALCNLFDDIWAVLKDEGTLYVNLGDTYSGNGSITNTGRRGFLKGEENIKFSKGNVQAKRKSLIGIPAMFQLEMIKRGWILRNKIIWNKTNCMPEKIQDRFTNDYEEIFFFTKQQKYFFNRLFEPYSEKTLTSFKNGIMPVSHAYLKNGLKAGESKSGMRNSKEPWLAAKYAQGRNMRSVWKIATTGTKFGHYSTFPVEIAKKCIKSGCPKEGIVLDPFAGTGTTLFVASTLGMHSIGFELVEKNYNFIKENIVNYPRRVREEFEQTAMF